MANKLRKTSFLSILIIFNFVVLSIGYIFLPSFPEIISHTHVPEIEHFINIQDMKLRYLELGSGPTLLFLHGFAAHAETWLPTMMLLKDHFRMIALDLPGHGKSEKPHLAYTPDFFISHVEQFCDELALSHMTIIGNSMGGGIAANLALKRQDIVSGLVLVDSVGYPNPLLAFAQDRIVPLLYPYANIITSRWIVRIGLKQVYYDDRKVTPEIIDDYARFFQNASDGYAALSTLHHLHYEETIRALQSINQPTLIIWGDHDRWVPASHASIFKNQIVNSQVAVIKNCGHIGMEECVNDFTRVLLEFLVTESTQPETIPSPNR